MTSIFMQPPFWRKTDDIAGILEDAITMTADVLSGFDDDADKTQEAKFCFVRGWQRVAYVIREHGVEALLALMSRDKLKAEVSRAEKAAAQNRTLGVARDAIELVRLELENGLHETGCRVALCSSNFLAPCCSDGPDSLSRWPLARVFVRRCAVWQSQLRCVSADRQSERQQTAPHRIAMATRWRCAS